MRRYAWTRYSDQLPADEGGSSHRFTELEENSQLTFIKKCCLDVTVARLQTQFNCFVNNNLVANSSCHHKSCDKQKILILHDQQASFCICIASSTLLESHFYINSYTFVLRDDESCVKLYFTVSVKY